jgi:hypothetical protein
MQRVIFPRQGREKGTLTHCRWECKFIKRSGNDQAYIQRNESHMLKRYLHSHVQCNSIIVKKWKLPK